MSTVDETGKPFSSHVNSIANATVSRLSLLSSGKATGNFVEMMQRILVEILLDSPAAQLGTLGVGANNDASIHTR